MCALVTALTSVLLSALLSSQVPLNPVQSEEKLAPPSALQSDTEAEKQLIREVRPLAGGPVAGRGGEAGSHGEAVGAWGPGCGGQTG